MEKVTRIHPKIQEIYISILKYEGIVLHSKIDDQGDLWISITEDPEYNIVSYATKVSNNNEEEDFYATKVLY